MTLWRVSNHPTLDGAGGLRAPGRWHHRGQRIVYCAPNPATALLEVLVHAEIDLEDLPASIRYLEVEAPDSLAVETVQPGDLSSTWRANTEATQRIGDEWLRSARTALLRVPCVIVPETWNILLNPQQPHAGKVRVARVHDHGIDARLFR